MVRQSKEYADGSDFLVRCSCGGLLATRLHVRYQQLETAHDVCRHLAFRSFCAQQATWDYCWHRRTAATEVAFRRKCIKKAFKTKKEGSSLPTTLCMICLVFGSTHKGVVIDRLRALISDSSTKAGNKTGLGLDRPRGQCSDSTNTKEDIPSHGGDPSSVGALEDRQSASTIWAIWDSLSNCCVI